MQDIKSSEWKQYILKDKHGLEKNWRGPLEGNIAQEDAGVKKDAENIFKYYYVLEEKRREKKKHFIK